MQNPPGFDYNQPSRDTLAGIYVEGSDSAAAHPAAEMPAGQGGQVTPDQTERLFGVTLTVDDENPADRPNRTPQTG
jgi:hypothetical protein